MLSRFMMMNRAGREKDYAPTSAPYLLCHFDDTYTDESANNHTFITNTTGFAGGKFATNALSTNSSYIRCQTLDSLNSATNFTIDTWMYFNSVAQAGIIGSDSTASHIFFKADNTLEMGLPPAFVGVPFTPSVGTWYHLAFEKSGNTYRVYIDGTLVSTTSNATNVIFKNNANGTNIGAVHGGGFAASTRFEDFRIMLSAEYGGVNFTPNDKPYGIE